MWGEGNILLGGGGSDTIEGRGGDDIIDGDRYLSVRLSVRVNAANPASETGSTDLFEHTAVSGTFGAGTTGMSLQQAVFAGLVDPGNIVAVREIVSPPVPAADCGSESPLNCDTALFSAPQSEYGVLLFSNGTVRVTHNVPLAGGGGGGGGGGEVGAGEVGGGGVGGGGGLRGSDGIDMLSNVEQLVFCDFPNLVTKDCAVRSAPVSLPSFPTETLSASSLTFPTTFVSSPAVIQTVTLANTGGGTLIVAAFSITGANAASFSATSNCIALSAGTSCDFNVAFAPTTAGPKTAQLNIGTSTGSQLAVSLAGAGATNSPATGAPTISDITPTEGAAVTASTVGIADANGLPGVFSFQWLQSNVGGGGALTNIGGATGPTFTPLPAQANRRLAVAVSFVDLAGALETRTSVATSVTGDLFPGVGDNNTGVNVLTGTAGQDEYHGGAGNDNLSTGAENDVVSGDAGDDIIATGAGDDTITFTGTGEGFDAVTGSAGVDAILALANDTDIGMRSISTVENIDANGHTGVRILGSSGNDALNLISVVLTGIVAIDGGGGNDALTGSAAADVIIGRGGSDVIKGGFGNDTIEGGAGNDSLNGGTGNDTFRYVPGGSGSDTITGFDANPSGGQDTIELTGLGITAATFAANVTITNAGGGATLITIAGQGTIRLVGVTVSAVTVTDFVLA